MEKVIPKKSMYPLVKDQVYEVAERNGDNICIEVDGIKYGYHESHFDSLVSIHHGTEDIVFRNPGINIVPIERDSIMAGINAILEENNVNLQHRDLLWKMILTSFERLYDQVVSSTDEYNDIVQSVLQSKSC